MTAETIHTCSYSCERPECIRAQRDELAARVTAETSDARGDWPERYACNGPEGTFWTDDAALANKLIAAAFDRDEWTVTDTQNPTAAPPPAAAEPKTLPVPTRVYLTDKAAVIVGTPERGWDEDAQDAHNCDAMGCATIGPHVLARVPFTDERAMSQAAEAQAQVGGEVVQRLRGVLEHGKMGDKCLIAPDLVTAAIAALSAQQSPAEAQPVAKLVNRKDADGGKTTTFIRPTSLGMDLPLGEYPLHLHPPPSAPVGVDAPGSHAWMAEVCRAAALSLAAHGVRNDQLSKVADWIAQQPAAVD